MYPWNCVSNTQVPCIHGIVSVTPRCHVSIWKVGCTDDYEGTFSNWIFVFQRLEDENKQLRSSLSAAQASLQQKETERKEQESDLRAEISLAQAEKQNAEQRLHQLYNRYHPRCPKFLVLKLLLLTMSLRSFKSVSYVELHKYVWPGWGFVSASRLYSENLRRVQSKINALERCIMADLPIRRIWWDRPHFLSV